MSLYEKFRQACEASMPVLFVGACLFTGMSAAQHDYQNTFLFAISMIGTLPIFHKKAWEPLICRSTSS